MHQSTDRQRESHVVAVLMTCHNRLQATVSCLRSLARQAAPAAELILFITDDGSSDGTPDAVVSVWPEATVIRGDGNLYWAAGMALAERAAVQDRPDYLLWLNDDTILDERALARMLATAYTHPRSIIVGAVTDPDSGEITYGGRVRVDRHPQRFRKLPCVDHPQRAHTFNGNLVLIPWDVRQLVGPIDGLFPHAYADDDYGLRATALGIPIIQAPGYMGHCRLNPGRPRSVGGPLTRWRELQAPKAMSWRAQARYLSRHGDWRWPILLVGGQLQRALNPYT